MSGQSARVPAAEVGKPVRDMFDGHPHMVTETDMRQPWSGYSDGRCFRCYLCGAFFKPGNVIRYIWCSGVKEAREANAHCGNVFLCDTCDGPDVYQRLAEHERIGKQRHWNLIDPERLPRNPYNSPARKCR